MSSGGARPGAGRKPDPNKKVTLTVRISQDARDRIVQTAEFLGWSKGKVIEELLGGYEKMTES